MRVDGGDEIRAPHTPQQAPSGREVRVRTDLGGVGHTRLYEALDATGRPIPGPRVAIVGHMHGNETVGREVIDRFDGLAAGHLRAGSVLTVLANVEAMHLDVRYTPTGRDMNRLWDADSLARLAETDRDVLVYEERRVAELAPLLLTADAVFDLHSTSRPSPPHLVFRDDHHHAAIAARLGVARLVTGVHEGGVLDGGLCSNIGLRAGQNGPRLGFTLEAGEHRSHENLEHAWQAVQRFLIVMGVWAGELPADSADYEVYEVLDRFRQAPRGSVPYRFVGYEGGEPGGGRFAPARRLESFEHVEADEILLRRDTDEVIRAKGPFTMLMPAPTAGPGEDLFYFTQRRHAALRRRPETDDEARVEAEAVERVLDLLSDDESERGIVRASFTARRTLDACAEMVSRVLRLPEGHPHRRLLVVGRGDWEREETERRAGARYRESMRRAIAAGVPIERVQLLRGAGLGFLRHLLSPGHGAFGRPDASMRLLLSLQQPNTVSLLVAGDLALGAAEGERRHIGVALVVEAATVEPTEGMAHVRIARTGLFGARPELLRVVRTLVDGMRSEHRLLMHTTDFGQQARDGGLVDAEGGLVARDPDQLAALSKLVTGLQWHSWVDALRPEITRPLVLDDDAALGRWLARIMASSGILDPSSLREAMVVRHGSGWAVLPERLDAAEPPSAVEVPGRPPLPVVLDAGDVDRENIERWIGWKRFTRELELIPGERGKDLDLAFTSDAIQRRLTAWLDHARAVAAADDEGQWMVVLAGDGLDPDVGSLSASAADFLQAHRALLRDPTVRYLRIQHAQGTHLSWLRGLIEDLGQRPGRGAPVSLGWETEHGASVNVMLLARRADDAHPAPWSLEGWTVSRCAVILAGVEDAEGQARVGLFTQRDRSGRLNQELAHFGRAHCHGLLSQASWRLSGLSSPSLRVSLDNVVTQLLTKWVEAARMLRGELPRVQPDERLPWLASRLGLRDPVLVGALLQEMEADEAPASVARRLWSAVEPWPGELVVDPGA